MLLESQQETKKRKILEIIYERKKKAYGKIRKKIRLVLSKNENSVDFGFFGVYNSGKEAVTLCFL